MGFDKNKVMRAAERFLAQGRIPSAIKEYKSVLENDPSDVNTQNMLGDLYLKSDNKKEAVKCYTDVADYYNSHGYEKKAIAIYNKLHRIEPDSPEVSIKLAELYEVRGAHAEAEKHYEQVSTYYEKKGNKVDALTIWEKIAQISPKNTEIYLKIGNFYWQNNQKEEAARAFTEGGLRLSEIGRHEEAIAAFSRSFEVAPGDLAAVRGFVNSQISLGYTEEAIKMLDELYERDPYNADVVFLLADCYIDMDQPDRAEIIIVELITREPKAYAKLLHLIDFYMKRNDLDSSIRILTSITEQLLVSQKPERLLDLLNEITARNPEELQALRLLIRYYSWHKNDFELKKVLEQLAEAANYNDSIEDEKFAITQLLVISPEEAKYVSRLKEINEIEGSQESDVADSVPAESESGEKIPTFESFEGLLNGNGNGSAGVSEFEIAEDETIPVEIDPEDIQIEDEIKLTEADLQSAGEASEAVTGPKASDLDVESHIANLEFYIEQGYIDIALETLKELDDRFGERAEFDEIRTILAGENIEQESAVDTEAAAETGSGLPDTQNNSDEAEAAPEDIVTSAAVNESEVADPEGDPQEAPETPAIEQEADVSDEMTSAEAEAEEKAVQAEQEISDDGDDELIEKVEVRGSESESSAVVFENAEEGDSFDQQIEKPDLPSEPEPEESPGQAQKEPAPAAPVDIKESAADEKYQTHYH
ncbi:MAG: tetratricopeptide repeat protein, partial [Acidobacteria bacterium]|nr:tetratricopeptide repeat protein [Acidobacteriota bacterium]